MEKLKILIIVMFLGLGAYSQTVPGYTTIRARYKWIGGGFDSVLVVPAYSTTPSGLRSQYARAGQLGYDSVNNKLYVYDGGWALVMDTANKWITFLYRKTASDSVFYVKGGTHTFAFIDSTGGGSTPTLQQVFDAESNTAVFTAENEINANGFGFSISGGSFLQFNSDGWGQVTMTDSLRLEAAGLVHSTGIFITPDSIKIYPKSGQLNIDSLRSWSGISDTTYKKVMTWDTRNGRWEYSNWFGGSGSSDSSYLFFDTTYNRLGTVVSTDTSIVKSLRIQLNGSTVTPTVTDSTINWDLTGLATSLTNGLTLSAGVGKWQGALTEATNITNASGHTVKIHLDEDDSDVGFIGDTYNSLIGFQNGNIVLSQNGGTTAATVTSTYSGFQAASGGYSTEFLVYRNKVQVNPHLGAFYVDTLTSAVGTKALRYNPTTGLVSYADTTTGGGGLEKGVTTIASSATRRILYDSSGILQNNGKFLLNANDELQINNETDEGDHKLQVKGDVFLQATAGSGTGYLRFESTTGTHHAIQYDGTQMFVKGASTLILGDFGTGNALQIYNQRVYIAPGGGTGSARLEIGAGTSSVAPFALTAGTNKSTAQNGSFEYNGTNFFVTRTGNAREGLLSASAVNSVSPTSPNRTITVNIDGTTYYIAAKTTND